MGHRAAEASPNDARDAEAAQMQAELNLLRWETADSAGT